MKKRTIWTIAVIMGLSFLALLLLQLNYIEEMAEMKREQFDESVNRALYQASRNMELNETLRYLERDVDEKESQGASKQGGRSGRSKAGYSSFQMKTVTNKPSQTPKAMILRNDSSSISATKKSLQEIVRNRYVYQKSMLDEVVYNILYSASEKPLKERVNFKLLDQDLKAEMMNNGINTLVFKTEKTSTTLNLSLLTEGYDADAKVKLHQCGSTVRLSVNGRGRRDLLIGR